MTAVDHAELKRVAEGASAFNYEGWTYQPPSDPMCAGRIMASEYGPVIATVQWPVPMMDHVLSGVDPSQPVGAYIAAANPAVVLEILSEIEGLKAEQGRIVTLLTERDDAERRLSEYFVAMREAQADAGIYKHDKLEAERQLAALRTQAPDSWRPMSEAPTDRIIIAMCRYPTASAGSPDFVSWDGTDGWIYSRNKPERVVCWAWKPREILGDWPQEAALRPQTAESGT